MNEKQKKTISKFLSLVLRHSPQTIGLNLDNNGWADVEELISKSAMHKTLFTKEELQEVVATNDKQRFAFDDSLIKVRASQGHSIEVELNLQPVMPPEFLYHGTVEKFLSSIKIQGLQKMNRQHVHLSKDIATAEKVGNRRGKAIILRISSGVMYADGYTFYVSENRVWLTESVSAIYINFKNNSD